MFYVEPILLLLTDSCRGDRVTSNGLYEMTYFVEGDAVDFTITVETTGWVGLGFSTDQLMVSGATRMYIHGVDVIYLLRMYA